MSSMWRIAFLSLAVAATASSSSAQYAAPRRPAPRPRAGSQCRLCDHRLAAAAPEQRLPLRRLCALPQRQPRLARRANAAPLGRESDAAGRGAGDRHRLLPPPTSRSPATASPAFRRAGKLGTRGRSARGGAQRLGIGRPAGQRRAGDLARATGAASPPPTMTAAPMRCCSPRKPTTRRGSPRSPARAPGGVRRADRDAAQCRRCRKPLSAG